MKPEIIRHGDMCISIWMPLPNSMAKDIFSLDEWQMCYGEETMARKILMEVKKRNGHITDIGIIWVKAEFQFQVIFQSKSYVDDLMQAVKTFIE